MKQPEDGIFHVNFCFSLAAADSTIRADLKLLWQAFRATINNIAGCVIKHVKSIPTSGGMESLSVRRVPGFGEASELLRAKRARRKKKKGGSVL